MLHKPFALAALLAASCAAPAAANDDLAAIRSQIDEMKKSYEQRIAALEQKLVQAESKSESKSESQAKTNPPVAASPVNENRVQAPSTASASSFNPEVSLILQGQYKNMKDVPERGISGFVPASGHDHGDGTIESINKRGFSVDHTELVFSANVDPNWRARPRLTVQSKPSTSQSSAPISSSHRPPPLVNTIRGMRTPWCSRLSCASTRAVYAMLNDWNAPSANTPPQLSKIITAWAPASICVFR